MSVMRSESTWHTGNSTGSQATLHKALINPPKACNHINPKSTSTAMQANFIHTLTQVTQAYIACGCLQCDSVLGGEYVCSTGFERQEDNLTSYVGQSPCLSFLPLFHRRVVFLCVFIHALFLYFYRSTPTWKMKLCRYLFPLVIIV